LKEEKIHPNQMTIPESLYKHINGSLIDPKIVELNSKEPQKKDSSDLTPKKVIKKHTTIYDFLK